ncbi:gamma-glutamyl hydrolase [Monoraphidium neglectum]|uniref:folate gamma-glutamyl hydrolase n=1 Tax=Monoraphidium neglectum TaxID=145388 RepID=A0A0D2KDN3_9CHLO|nr:gamma-glutamyl hydrolase [Monoraphidium neglectum]KIY93948.1 gamma-glutamyl hydrolase [Monoraphidium neglectum]|eukprot:XP_013892968.1 gamma-glutamyl hydrolase [Monoraphidium neglectum]
MQTKKALSNSVNERPIIGILSQPGAPAPDGDSYIAASYIKWVEAAGARVIPIFYDDTQEDIRRKFAAINGLLLPGGGARLKPGHLFYDTAAQLVGLAIKANDAGDYFPVHGTCLGMETLSIIVSGNYSLLADMDAEDAAAPLLYTDVAEDSHFFSSLPPVVVRNLQNQAIAMENHMHGVLMTSYEENPKLKDFFKVLSLSLDRKGLPYISTMEARKYPITATQWHPEKNQYGEFAAAARPPFVCVGITLSLG